MKILLGYSYYQNPFDVKDWVDSWVKRLNTSDLDVHIETICLTLDSPGPRLTWKDLNKKWGNGDKKLFKLYKDILHKCEKFDVFLNWNGINLHPEFVKMIPVTKVYSCFDDPESSEDLSKPVANAYDLCLVGNIAELDMYKIWGVKKVEFWPLGYFDGERDLTITEEQIKSSERDIDVSMLCERVSPWRKERLDKFSAVFPQGSYYGRGWPNGFIKEEEKLKLYRRTKIGINIHNSTGPINFRTYMLPANGVMLLCDNKSHLSKLYKLGEEAVGFDTIEEAISLCEYYLKHDEERKAVALAGWKKAISSFNEIASFKMGIEHIKNLLDIKKTDINIKEQLNELEKYQKRALIKYYCFTIYLNTIKKIYRKLRK